jgi:hypothetical protein
MVILRVEAVRDEAGSNRPASEEPEPRLWGAARKIDKAELQLQSVCVFCNSFKQNKWPILDPCKNVYGAHFRVNEDGTIEGLSIAGWRMIRFLRLDRDKLSTSRTIRL